MAGAMVEGWRLAGVDLSDAVVIRPSGKAVEGMRTVTRFAEAGPPPRLACSGSSRRSSTKSRRPAPFLTCETVVVSILAGVEAATFASAFRTPERSSARCRTCRSRCAAAWSRSTAPTRTNGARPARNLFAPLGFAMWMADEGKLAAIGSVAGAGPAYVARFIDGLAKAGAKRGLSEDIAETWRSKPCSARLGWPRRRGEEMDVHRQARCQPERHDRGRSRDARSDDVLDELDSAAPSEPPRPGGELAEAARAKLAEAERLP